ncbi:unnamed protein product [Schistocephalus solidus]|uniref:DDE-1 domain-containing protein n=1 Tax=Schistocephalus solidus TaxID=70667 RepID=A0A183SK06_SCHSO|nr:unnamed protein product [Schistocephalus solidus]
MYPVRLQSDFHLGDEGALSYAAINITDGVYHQQILSILPPHENVVRWPSVQRSGLHLPNPLLHWKMEGGGQVENMFHTSLQKKDVVIITAAETIETKKKLM